MAPKNMKKASKQKTEKVYTVEQLIEKANVAVNSMQLELAEKFYCKAISMEPENTNIMDALADVYLQLGEMDNALQLLLKSTSAAPHENPFKWMFLGQLQKGMDAVESYTSGITIMNKLLELSEHTESPLVLKRQIAKAHCSIADIFLTDLCMEECAEASCEREVMSALAVDPQSLDGLQTLASMRLSQSRRKEAAEAIALVHSNIVRIRDVVRARTVIDELSGAEEPAEFEENPEFEFCIATAKLLIECSPERPDFANNAMDLISDLLQDDDENIELWYLMGVAALSCSPPDTECAKYNLDRALEMMDRLREDCCNEGEEFPFEEQYGLVTDHLRILGDAELTESAASSNTVNPGQPAIATAEEGDDEEWSSCDEEDEEMQS